MRKKLFGIFLLILAVLVLLQGNFGILSLDQDIWPLLPIAFLGYEAVNSLLRKHLTSATFFALVAVIVANHFYEFIPVSNHSLIWASILAVIGVSYLTHSSKSRFGKKAWYGDQTIITEKEVAFGSGTFYKQNQELIEDQVSVAFGKAQIYYDNAEILGDLATINVEVGFGKAVIYIPKHWRVDLKVETAFGAAKADASTAPTSKTVVIRGEVAFGKLQVVYVK